MQVLCKNFQVPQKYTETTVIYLIYLNYKLATLVDGDLKAPRFNSVYTEV